MILKYRILAFIFFIVSMSQASAQQDTLATKSYQELSDIVNTNFGINDSLALAASQFYIAKAIKENDIDNQWRGYIGKGRVYSYLGDEQSFIEASENAIKIILENNLNESKTRIYEMTADGYLSLTNVEKSLEYLDKARQIAINEGDLFTESRVLSRIAYINTRTGNTEEGLKINKLALHKTKQISTETDSLKTLKDRVLFSNHYALTSAYLTLEKADSALYHVDQSLKVSAISDSCTVKYVYFMQADGYILKNQLKKALQSLEKADEICLKNTRSFLLQANAYRGEIALNQKKYRTSVDYFLTAFREYNVKGSQEGFMNDIYKLTAKAYKGLGKLDSANFYLEKYINTSNELDRMKNDVYSVSKRQEADTFKKELDELSTQKEKKEKVLMYGSIGGGAVILFLALGLLRSNKKRKENEQKFEELLAKVTTAKGAKEIIDTKDEVLEEQTTTDINPETTQLILSGLKKLEDQNYFLHPACSAHNVAKRIKTNTTYLSKVINAEFGKNFSTYINDLRINHAIIKLKEDKKFRSYTISSIATELGYKSADSFTKYFKKDTGLLPSFYIKKLNQVA